MKYSLTDVLSGKNVAEEKDVARYPHLIWSLLFFLKKAKQASFPQILLETSVQKELQIQVEEYTV